MIGVCGLLIGPNNEGELGADIVAFGVSGLGGPGASRNECDDAREEGREMGLRLGVRNKNGTPDMSSLCACIKSNTGVSVCMREEARIRGS